MPHPSSGSGGTGGSQQGNGGSNASAPNTLHLGHNALLKSPSGGSSLPLLGPSFTPPIFPVSLSQSALSALGPLGGLGSSVLASQPVSSSRRNSLRADMMTLSSPALRPLALSGSLASMTGSPLLGARSLVGGLGLGHGAGSSSSSAGGNASSNKDSAGSGMDHSVSPSPHLLDGSLLLSSPTSPLLGSSSPHTGAPGSLVCHQCQRARPPRSLVFCCHTYSKKSGSSRPLCTNKYCEDCLRQGYPSLRSIQDYPGPAKRHDVNSTWECPACKGVCSCAACEGMGMRRGARGGSSGSPAAEPDPSSLDPAHTLAYGYVYFAQYLEDAMDVSPPSDTAAAEAAAAVGLANAATYAVATSPIIRPAKRLLLTTAPHSGSSQTRGGVASAADMMDDDAAARDAEEQAAAERAEARALAARRAQNVCHLPTSMTLLSSDEEADSDEEDQQQQRAGGASSLRGFASSSPRGRSLSAAANTKPLSSGIGAALGTILAASKSPLLQSLSERIRAQSGGNASVDPPLVKLEGAALAADSGVALKLELASPMLGATSSISSSHAVSAAPASSITPSGVATAAASPASSSPTSALLGIFAAAEPFQPTPSPNTQASNDTTAAASIATNATSSSTTTRMEIDTGSSLSAAAAAVASVLSSPLHSGGGVELLVSHGGDGTDSSTGDVNDSDHDDDDLHAHAGAGMHAQVLV